MYIWIRNKEEESYAFVWVRPKTLLKYTFGKIQNLDKETHKRSILVKHNTFTVRPTNHFILHL